MIFATFMYAVIIDNAKSLVLLTAIYMVVVRRFMHLSINEDQYIVRGPK